ncbi:MFS multidrug transporter [Seiridium cupressi]
METDLTIRPQSLEPALESTTKPHSEDTHVKGEKATSEKEMEDDRTETDTPVGGKVENASEKDVDKVYITGIPLIIVMGSYTSILSTLKYEKPWTYLIFFLIFELGSLICGLAKSSPMLIGGRAIAGLGGSGLMKLDLVGFALFAPAAVMFLLALQWGGNNYPWNSSVVIGLFVGAGATAILFVLWERHMGERAMLPGSVIKQRIVWSSAVNGMSLMAIIFTAAQYMPIYFQGVRGEGPAMSGVDLLPSILGQLFMAVMSAYTPWTETAKWAGYQILLGGGRGIGMQMGVVAVQNVLSPHQIPVGVAFLIFCQNFSGAIFVVVGTVIFTQSLVSELAVHASSVSPEAALAAGASASAVRSLVPAGSSELDGVLVSFANAISVRVQENSEWPLGRAVPSALRDQAPLTSIGTTIAVSLPGTVRLDTQWIFKYYGGGAEKPVADGTPLRIMTLGASVCRGDVSTGTVGFRKPLRDKLVSIGNMVNMVGSARVGEMKDNDVEAHPGNRVDQVHEWATHSVPAAKPNLFLMNVGSNDCLQYWDLPNYHVRLNDFIDFLLAQSPRATVVMSTLLTNTVPNTEPCILDVNRQIRELYEALREQGRPVVLAEMHDQFVPEGDTLERPHPAHISPDGTHPGDEGYAMMADIFYQTIREADSNGFFQAAEDVGIPDDGDAERDIEEQIQLAQQFEDVAQPLRTRH